MPFTLRPFTDQDFDLLAALTSFAVPDDPAGNADWLRARREFDAAARLRRHYLASDAGTGEPAGYAAVEQQEPDPKRFRVYLVFDPRRRWDVLGEFLWARLERDLRELGAAAAWAREYAHDTAFRDFLHRHGFVQTDLAWDMRLEVRTVPAAVLQSGMDRAASQGIVLPTLAEEQERNPDWLSWFCDMENTIRLNDPESPRTMEQMRQRLQWLEIAPESLFLAKAEGRYLGHTYLTPAEGDPKRLRQGMTDVRPDYRRRGIATALKARGIEYARRHGFEAIVSVMSDTNIASIRMNEKAGFRRAFGYVRLEKGLRAETRGNG